MIALIIYFLGVYFYSKRKYDLFLVLLFFLFTAGFQIVLNSFLLFGLPIDKLSDYGYLLVFTVLFLDPIKIERNKVNLSILLFFLFLVVSVVYSVFYQSFKFSGVISVVRLYLIFVALFVLNRVPLNYLIKAFRFIMLITVFQCSVYLLQVIFRTPLLLENDGTFNVQVNNVSGYLRFYNNPPFMLISFLYYLFVDNKGKFKKLAMTISFLTILATFHRTFLIMSIFSIFVYLILFTNTKKWIGYSVIVFLIFLSLLPVFNSSSVISDRVNNTFESINAVDSNSISNFELGAGGNSLLFRSAHFYERFIYIIKDPIKMIFGVGLVTDNDPSVANLPFRIGVYNVQTGDVFKINTGDVLWSLLLLQLGFLGTFLYIRIFYYIFKIFSAFVLYNSYAVISFIALLQYFLTSISGTSMRRYEHILIILFLLPIVKKFHK